MIYADFYHDSDGLQGAVGDRSVVVLDGRERLGGQLAAAAAHGLKYGYKSFHLCRGDRLYHGRITSPLIKVQEVQYYG